MPGRRRSAGRSTWSRSASPDDVPGRLPLRQQGDEELRVEAARLELRGDPPAHGSSRSARSVSRRSASSSVEAELARPPDPAGAASQSSPLTSPDRRASGRPAAGQQHAGLLEELAGGRARPPPGPGRRARRAAPSRRRGRPSPGAAGPTGRRRRRGRRTPPPKAIVATRRMTYTSKRVGRAQQQHGGRDPGRRRGAALGWNRRACSTRAGGAAKPALSISRVIRPIHRHHPGGRTEAADRSRAMTGAIMTDADRSAGASWPPAASPAVRRGPAAGAGRRAGRGRLPHAARPRGVRRPARHRPRPRLLGRAGRRPGRRRRSTWPPRTPPTTRRPALPEAGKAVLCEKPFTLDLATSAETWSSMARDRGAVPDGGHVDADQPGRSAGSAS